MVIAMKKVFIVGSEGTTGLRLFKRLDARSDVELLSIDEKLRKDPNEIRRVLEKADYAFLCLPDKAARTIAELAESLPVKIIDSSTAHRTSENWAYGFPELSDKHLADIKTAKRVAVPGCHASGFISLIYPLIAENILPLNATLSCTSLSGYSGGGKKMIAEYEASDRMKLLESAKLYSMDREHKHLPEITTQCSLTKAPAFMPIVSDYYSGMLVTVPLHISQLNKGYSQEEIRMFYKKYYSGSGIVKVADKAQASVYSGFYSGYDGMEISVSGSGEEVLLCSNFDNLGKGASAAAVECFNIMCGLRPDYGLKLS